MKSQDAPAGGSASVPLQSRGQRRPDSFGGNHSNSASKSKPQSPNLSPLLTCSCGPGIRSEKRKRSCWKQQVPQREQSCDVTAALAGRWNPASLNTESAAEDVLTGPTVKRKVGCTRGVSAAMRRMSTRASSVCAQCELTEDAAFADARDVKCIRLSNIQRALRANFVHRHDCSVWMRHNPWIFSAETSSNP